MTEKKCYKCRNVKSVDNFSLDRSRKDGLQGYCKECKKEGGRRWDQIDPEARKLISKRGNLRRYNLTLEDLDMLLERQGGRCAICGTTESGGHGDRFHVDHDHACCPGKKSCGKCIRGLLCSGCNNGLGCFRDDPDALRRAIGYLAGEYIYEHPVGKGAQAGSPA